VSSFYEYTIRHDLYVGPNPLDRVKRMKRQLYTGAKPLPFKDGEIEQTIEAIPTKSLNGIRDKAMLYLALYTGRRLSEIAGLRCGDIERQKRDWVFTWHTKGNKTKTDILSMKCPAIPALAKWLKLFYKGEWPQDGIVFPSLSRATYGKRMSPQGLEQRCDRWLDTTKFHRLRHTFSAAYLESGGTVQGLSKQLGHANIAITTAYIESLDDGKNEQLDGMIDVYAGKQHRRSS
jgi:integrase/recombinase XerD